MDNIFFGLQALAALYATQELSFGCLRFHPNNYFDLAPSNTPRPEPVIVASCLYVLSTLRKSWQQLIDSRVLVLSTPRKSWQQLIDSCVLALLSKQPFRSCQHTRRPSGLKARPGGKG